MKPLFLGLSGPALTEAERILFVAADPAGYILFKRNCVDPDQIRALTDSLRDLAGRELPILIDQEGGRVARLQPPHWPLFPAAARFGALYDLAPLSALRAAELNGTALALTLRALGITVDCLPLIDVRTDEGHDIIGDRAFANEPMWVSAMGRATLDGLRAAGVVGVIKHIPGHGRALVDSHLELPVVTASREELERDFEPFRRLKAAPMAMTAHVVYTALDAQRCATLSPAVIDDIRRDIGFDGLLMSDDLGMAALGGSFAFRAQGALAAGCDIALHCSGDLRQIQEIVDAVGVMTPDAERRLAAAMAWPAPVEHDLEIVIAQRDELLAYIPA